jgi:hypothetical protein
MDARQQQHDIARQMGQMRQQRLFSSKELWMRLADLARLG